MELEQKTDTQISREDRIENPEISACICGQLICDTMEARTCRERAAFSISDDGKTGQLHVKRKEMSIFNSYTKIKEKVD